MHLSRTFPTTFGQKVEEKCFTQALQPFYIPVYCMLHFVSIAFFFYLFLNFTLLKMLYNILVTEMGPNAV